MALCSAQETRSTECALFNLINTLHRWRSTPEEQATQMQPTGPLWYHISYRSRTHYFKYGDGLSYVLNLKVSRKSLGSILFHLACKFFRFSKFLLANYGYLQTMRQRFPCIVNAKGFMHMKTPARRKCKGRKVKEEKHFYTSTSPPHNPLSLEFYQVASLSNVIIKVS